MTQTADKQKSGRHAGKLVKVSALAVTAMKCQIGLAQAQTVKITCKQPINIGNLIACSPGKYLISPGGAHSVLSGCLIINTAAIAGSCEVRTFKGPITKNITVKPTAASFVMTGGGSSVSVTNIKLQRRGSPTTDITLVITPGAISKNMTIDVGGTLRFKDKQGIGGYTGSVVITANIAP